MGIAGPHPGGAPARRRKRCPTGAGAPTPRGGGGVGAQSDSAYRLGKVLGAILHGVVERKRGSRGGDGVDVGGRIGWVNVIGFVERPGKPLLRNISGPRTPF